MTQIPAAGIDIGFYQTKYTLGRRTGELRPPLVKLFPSYAARRERSLDSSLLFGRKERGWWVEVDDVSYFVGPDVMKHIDDPAPRAVISNYSTLAEYKALLLGALGGIADGAGASGEVEIRVLVVGLPVASYAIYKPALERLVVGDHVVRGSTGEIRVRVQATEVIQQPVGALISGRLAEFLESGDPELVLDLGGGTFDWFVCEEGEAHLPRCGSVERGMLACGQAALKTLNDRYATQPRLVARARDALAAGKQTVKVGNAELSLANAIPHVHAILGAAIDQMCKGVGPHDDIPVVRLTGGGARLLDEVLKKKEPSLAARVKLDSDPVFSNVRGFHEYAEALVATVHDGSTP